jgi:diphthine synthase
LLFLIGVGINEGNSLSIDSIDILKKSKKIYVDSFTGFLSDSFIHSIKTLLDFGYSSEIKNKTVIQFVKRWFVEDGREILEDSVKENVSILIYGDPLIATTYSELLVRARKQSISYKVIHSSSGISSLIGESGLHYYKFGKMVTMMSDPMSSITVYNTIYNNMCLGLHTLILTEYNNDYNTLDSNKNKEPFFLSPQKVFCFILERESELKLLNLTDNSFAIVASKIGTDKSTIVCGKIKSLLNYQFDDGFNSIIIPSSLHFTEIDCLRNLTILLDDPSDNSTFVDTMSIRMLKKYIPNVKKALSNLRDVLQTGEKSNESEYKIVFENAENYLFDAENFYRRGQFELAILSIGYAEGLIDSIRYQKGMNPW